MYNFKVNSLRQKGCINLTYLCVCCGIESINEWTDINAVFLFESCWLSYNLKYSSYRAVFLTIFVTRFAI